MASLRILAAIAFFFACLAAARADAPASYSQMLVQINKDCAASPLIRVAALGKSASDDRTIWMVRLEDTAASTDRKPRVFILCRQHGDEPVSTQAALNLLDDLASGKRPDIASELKRVTVYILPMVNPDGADSGTRDSSNGADLNRDWGPFHQPETRAVYAAFREIRPQMVLDMHSWDEGDPFRGYCLEAPRVGVPGDPQIAQAARDLQQRGVLSVREQTGQQIAVTNYGVEADPSLCHRFFLEDAGVVSLLFETEPDDAGQSFDRRVAVAQAAIAWLIDDTAHQPVWKQIAAREAKGATRDESAKAASNVGSYSGPIFLAKAEEDGGQTHSPFGAAARIVRNAARRVPAPIWWALGIYVLLWAARPIFIPRSGPDSEGTSSEAHQARRRRGTRRDSQKGRGLKRI